ncbi:serine hydrolase domain-containing protein [Stenotrophomonas bentonitica]|uniref:serine hydrolase domain-containing protein n=1 Tax=Stenotrophomonas bentonitica TaxID=1450134 RepID=UPI00345E8B74
MRAGLLCLSLVPMLSAHAASPPDLVGVWGNETVSGPLLVGEITLDGRAGVMQAEIAGLPATVQREGSTITFSAPGQHGHFRGRMIGKEIRGVWIQPAGQTQSSEYATPVSLAQTDKQVWRGTLAPLPDRLSQYIHISRNPDASLHAYLGNPAYNLGRGRSYDVTVEGDTVVLTDPKRKGWALNGRFDSETDQLRMEWQGIGVFAFTRRERDQAIGYYATTPADANREYRVPVPAQDGWATASLQDQGMRLAPMTGMLEHLQTLAAPEPGKPQVHSVLVARNGKLVFESYFHGYSRERAHDTRSAGKSFASLLVGMAIQQGADLSPNTPALSRLPDYATTVPAGDARHAITLANLMSMNSGLACDDYTGDSPGNEDTMQGQREQRDWYRFTLALPMTHAPGADKAVYCSAGINLLGGVVREATGRPLTELFEEWVARPMQMRGYHLNLAPNDDVYLGGGMFMRPRDLLKLGQLYLDGGVWQGKRLVASTWIDDSVARHTTFGPNHDYGYAWHLHTFQVRDHDYRAYAAEGNGGQFVIVIPELKLVAGITAGSYGEFSTWYPLQDLVAEYIIPAALPEG